MALDGTQRSILGQFLDSLSDREVERLVGVLEKTKTAEGTRGGPPLALPVDDVMGHLRPRLRHLRPRRTPNLRRLLCEPLAPLLDDGPPVPEPDEKPAVASRAGGPAKPRRLRRRWAISRSSIDPIWQLLRAMAARDLDALGTRFEAAVRQGDRDALAEVAAALYGRAAAALETASKPILEGNDRVRRDIEQRMGIETLSSVDAQGHLHDAVRAADALRHHAELMPAMAAVRESAQAEGALEEGRILRLGDRTFARIRDLYLQLADSIGPDAGLLPAMVMRRMEEPWDMLRLPRALSRTGADALLRESDLAVIMDMLVARLEQLAGNVDEVLPPQRRTFQGDAPVRLPLDTVAAAGRDVAEFARMATSILRDMRFPPDSAWRQSIAASQARLTRVVEGGLLAQLSETITHLFDRGRPTGDLDTPLAEAALQSARALAALTEMPGAQGSVTAVRVAIRGIRQRLWRDFEQGANEYRHRRIIAEQQGLNLSGDGPDWDRLTRMSDVLRALFPNDERGDAADVLRRARRTA